MTRARTLEALLDDAVRAVDLTAWADAANLLCEAWHHTPSARIANLVALLDARVLQPSVIRGRTVADREAHWCELAAARDPALLPGLLAVAWPRNAEPALARIDALVRWPPSVRISNALLALHRRRPYMIQGQRYPEFSKLGAAVAARTFDLLLAAKDPAAGRYLDELAEDPRPEAVYERHALAAQLRRRRSREPSFAAAARHRLAALERVLAAPDPVLARLLDAVYANPHDDAPRLVLADHLQHAGDPRGELIVLQLRDERAARDRARELLRVGARTWCEPLLEDGARDIQFARGLPARATATSYRFAAPAWATIESLVLAAPPADVFAGSELLRGVRRLHGVPSERLSLIRTIGSETRCCELELVTLAGIRGLDAPTILAPRSLGFPIGSSNRWVVDLRALVRRLHETPIGRGVRALVLGIDASEVAFAIQLLASNPQLEEIRLTGELVDRTLATSRVLARLTRRELALHRIDAAILAALARVEEPLVARISVSAVASPELQRELEALAGRWRRRVEISCGTGRPISAAGVD